MDSGFVDIDLEGIPPKGEVVPSRSEKPPLRSFLEQMKQYQHNQGEPTDFVPFRASIPSYQGMNPQQREYYFYFRHCVREKQFIETQESYLFLLAYELLWGLGWNTAEEGYEILLSLWRNYGKSFPVFSQRCYEWVYDFVYQHQLCFSGWLEVNRQYSLTIEQKNLMLDYYSQKEKVPFRVLWEISSLGNYAHGFLDKEQALLQEAVEGSFASLETGWKTQGETVFVRYFQGNTIHYSRFLYGTVLFPSAKPTLEKTVPNYAQSRSWIAFIDSLLSYVKFHFRQLGYGEGDCPSCSLGSPMESWVNAYLQGSYPEALPDLFQRQHQGELQQKAMAQRRAREEEKALQCALEAQFQADKQAKALEKQKKEEESRKIHLDFQKISALREESKQVREALWVPEQEEESLPQERESLPAEPSPPDSPTQESTLPIGESTGISPLEEGLSPFLREVWACICKEDWDGVETLAQEAFTLVDTVVDEINGIALEILGDIILEPQEEGYQILEEYQ